MRSGTIPLWNPDSFGGQPLYSDGSSAFAYPPKLLLADTVSPTAAHDILSVLHVTLAGLFTYWLLVDLEVSPLAALLGAVAWMFGSFTLAWLQLEVVAPLFAWFPAGLVTMRRAVTRSWMWVPVAALSIGMLFLSTHLLFADICMVAICAYGGLLAVSHLIRRWRSGERSTAVLAALRGASAAVLGIGVASVVLVPTAYALKDISRQPLTFGEITKTFILSPLDLKYAILPPGLPITDPKMEWGMAFVGTLTAIFALVGLVLRRKGSGLGRGLVIGAVAIAVGGPVSWLAYRVIPGMNVFRPYSRLLFVFDMGVVVLGAVGLDAAMRAVAGSTHPDGSVHRHSATRVAADPDDGGSPGCSVSWSWPSPHCNSASTAGRSTPRSFRPRLVARSTSPPPRCAAAGRGFVAGWPNRVLPANDSLNGWQPPMLDSNVSLIFDVGSASGYDSSVPTRTVDLWRVVSGESPDGVIATKLAGAFQPTFDAPRVRFDLLPRVGVDQIALTPAASALPAVTGALGRVGLEGRLLGTRRDRVPVDGTAHRAGGRVPGDGGDQRADALVAFARPDFDYRKEVILEGSRSLAASATGTATVTSATEGFNTASITTQASRAGLLVVPEMWDKGWSATVNGRTVPVLRANFNQQAVRVPGGTASVELTFRPVGLAKGVVITAASLAVCAGIALWGIVRRMRRSRRSAGPTALGS